MNKDIVCNFGRVGVLMGGCSSEREISFKSGQAVLAALLEAGVDAFEVVIDSEDAAINRQFLKELEIDLAFIALHGQYGEDGGIQSLLEDMNIGYVGSGPEASRRAINKVLTQSALKEADLSVADFCVVRKGDHDLKKNIEDVFQGDAVVIKPASQGSSIGIFIVTDYSDLESALEQAFEYEEEILIERFIKGRELTVGVLGDQVLPIVEICPRNSFFDFEAKYQKGLTDYIVPAEMADDMALDIQYLGLKASHVIGCRDFSRVDFIVSEDGVPYILEINTIPGFTETSLLPMAAQCAGYDFCELCVKLIKMAQARN